MLTKLLSFIGATVGGGIGWWAGESYGFVVAFMVSMVGTGFGIYYGRKLGRHYDI
ncbi:MAG: hypothetical protein ABJE10_12960 [bacterium]